MILTIYKGNRLIQKEPHPNYITKKPDHTKEFKQDYVEDAHKAIVSKELWEACQIERERTKREAKYGNPFPKPGVRCYPNSHPLFGKLVCPNCGSPYERVTQ